MNSKFLSRWGLFLLLMAALVVACSDDDHVSAYEPVSPVVLDPASVPYPKLSDYRFFEGPLQDQQPSHKVLPYRPASELFSDYAKKKRFVWMPAGAKASYNGDANSLNFPVGSVLIKTFYYDNVLPGNTVKIIETRLMIKVSEDQESSSGWNTYDYIWNDEQTEAFLDVSGNGATVPVTIVQNGTQRHIDYKVPADHECRTCHKHNPTQSAMGEVVMPLGPKPQNMNFVYNYGNLQQNQLQKWITEGYLEDNLPATISSTVDYKDSSQPLELRVRSYMDMNCAHCHRDGGHCDYTGMRFDFATTNMADFGVCMEPIFPTDGTTHIIAPSNLARSELYARMNTTDASTMMPLMGRTQIHEEGVTLVAEWINSLNNPCD